jgi:hypothetical protein
MSGKSASLSKKAANIIYGLHETPPVLVIIMTSLQIDAFLSWFSIVQ